MNQKPVALVWADIETTGLDYNKDLILEVAFQITDLQGTPISELESYLTITEGLQAATYLAYRKCLRIVREMHSKNGLWNEALFDTDVERLDISQVVAKIHTAVQRVAVYQPPTEYRLAGSTVGFDKRFIETKLGEELPRLSRRTFDLSTLRTLARAKGIEPDDLIDAPQDTHRAADDVRRDIETWQKLYQLLID